MDLEGMVTAPMDAPSRSAAVVVCHPHPQYGGDMNNGVVAAICGALEQEGIVSLRFNFRGVGASEGAYDEGKGEVEDLKAALGFLGNWPGVDKGRVGVAGYSFGAMVTLAGAKGLKGAKALALVSPPGHALEGQVKPRSGVPLLFVVGSEDATVRAQTLEERMSNVAGEARLEVVPGANHFWRGQEGEAAELVARFFGEALS